MYYSPGLFCSKAFWMVSFTWPFPAPRGYICGWSEGAELTGNTASWSLERQRMLEVNTEGHLKSVPIGWFAQCNEPVLAHVNFV